MSKNVTDESVFIPNHFLVDQIAEIRTKSILNLRPLIEQTHSYIKLVHANEYLQVLRDIQTRL